METRRARKGAMSRQRLVRDPSRNQKITPAAAGPVGAVGRRAPGWPGAPRAAVQGAEGNHRPDLQDRLQRARGCPRRRPRPQAGSRELDARDRAGAAGVPHRGPLPPQTWRGPGRAHGRQHGSPGLPCQCPSVRWDPRLAPGLDELSRSRDLGPPMPRRAPRRGSHGASSHRGRMNRRGDES